MAGINGLGIGTTAKLLSVGAGALVGAGIWAALPFDKLGAFQTAPEEFGWAGVTAVGSGISFAMMNRQDMRLYQGATKGTHVMLGIGLGLAVAHAINGVTHLGPTAPRHSAVLRAHSA